MDLFRIALFCFVATLFVLIVAFRYISSRQQIRIRLTSFADESSRDGTAGLRGIIKQLGVYFESVSWAKKKEDLMMQAGIPFRGSEFMVISVGAAVLGAALLLVFARGNLWLVVPGGLLAFHIPTFIVNRRVKKKQALLNEQLPTTLIMMANALRSGYSYLQAIELVSKEMPAPISEEFSFVLKEMNLGIGTEDALTNMVKRVNTPDLDLTVTAFLIQRQVGGNLAELLDTIAATIRGRIKMKERIGTLTAQGKLSGIVLSLLPIFLGIVVYLLNPEYMTVFFNHPAGRVIIGVGLFFQLVGIFWMKKIVNIDV